MSFSLLPSRSGLRSSLRGDLEGSIHVVELSVDQLVVGFVGDGVFAFLPHWAMGGKRVGQTPFVPVGFSLKCYEHGDLRRAKPALIESVDAVAGLPDIWPIPRTSTQL